MPVPFGITAHAGVQHAPSIFVPQGARRGESLQEFSSNARLQARLSHYSSLRTAVHQPSLPIVAPLGKLVYSSQIFAVPSQLVHLGTVSRYASYQRRVVQLALASTVTSEVVSAAAVEVTPGGSMGVTVLINGASGKMGQAVAEAALKAGLQLAPFALAGPNVPNHKLDVRGVTMDVHGTEHRDKILDLALAQHPDLIIVDYTLPSAVNSNAEWYCQRSVPFVMGTSGGDRKKLLETVEAAGTYAVIAPQMGKQVVAFIAAMEALAEACPGGFSGYTLQVTESHQSTKVDTSGTAKEIVAVFQKLGIAFSVDEIEMVREPADQVARMKVPEEHLKGHAFHTYRVTSADGTVAFEFQHNVCGRTIYAEGTVDAVLFLARKIKEKAEKRLYNMVDVLRGGAMR